MRPLLVLAFFGVGGCANVLGLGEYGDAVDGSPEDAQGGGSDAGADAKADVTADAVASAIDAGGDVEVKDASGCVPTGPEACSDGIDNDCNGQTDCIDAACTAGYTCVPPLPNGWNWSAYDQGARPSCANGFTTPTDVGEGLVAPATVCTCGCTTTTPSCTTGNVRITSGKKGGNGCQDDGDQMESAAGGCQPLSQSIDVNNGAKVSVTAPSPIGGSCAANPTVSKPAVSYATQGRTCAFAGNVGAGCSGGDVCAPKAAPYKMCVVRTGDVACPAGFLVKHLTGRVVADTRGCSQCTCNFNQGACGGTLTLFSNNACTQNVALVTVNGTCQPFGNVGYNNYTYAPESTASCTGSAVAATGSAAFADLQSVCCAN